MFRQNWSEARLNSSGFCPERIYLFLANCSGPRAPLSCFVRHSKTARWGQPGRSGSCNRQARGPACSEEPRNALSWCQPAGDVDGSTSPSAMTKTSARLAARRIRGHLYRTCRAIAPLLPRQDGGPITRRGAVARPLLFWLNSKTARWWSRAVPPCERSERGSSWIVRLSSQ